MKTWVKDGRCKRECFANHEGSCRVLESVPTSGDCPFRRNDITIEKQYKDIERYNSLKSIHNG